MDTIPQDIWPVIANILDDKTKRQMRLASTKWFSIIQYNNFNIYFTRKEDIPVIVERLSKYSWPIKLGFQRQKFNNALDILNNVPKLTNLISLNVDEKNSPIDIDDVTLDHWMQLSTLSNLQVLGFRVNDLPKKLWYHFTKLTEWLATGPEAELTPILKQMSHLEALHFIDSSTTWPLVLIPYPEKLTRLRMSAPTSLEHDNEMCSRLTNLKDLFLYNSTEDFDITYATSLERCTFRGDALPSLATNTNLTQLEIRNKKWTSKNAEDVAKLTKLQSLTFQVFPGQEEQFELEFSFMSHLKQLRKFRLDDSRLYPTNIMDSVYEYLPRSLKSLTLETDVDLARLVDLDLEELFAEKSTNHSQCLSKFSNLTSLSIVVRHRDFDLNSISSLTRLEDLTLLPAIEEFLEPEENYKCDFLYGLTNLTQLRVYCNYHHDSLWRNLVQLTKIQSLKISGIDSDDRILLLTSFKNLTTLEIDPDYNTPMEKFTGIHFTALTSLQVIWFRGDSSHLVHKKEDLKKTLPYLFNYSYFTYE